MVDTLLGVTSLVLNVLFLAAITWLTVKYFQERKRANNLVKELDNDSLEHYLNQIKKRGFDVTVKPSKKGKKEN